MLSERISVTSCGNKSHKTPLFPSLFEKADNGLGHTLINISDFSQDQFIALRVLTCSEIPLHLLVFFNRESFKLVISNHSSLLLHLPNLLVTDRMNIELPLNLCEKLPSSRNVFPCEWADRIHVFVVRHLVDVYSCLFLKRQS